MPPPENIEGEGPDTLFPDLNSAPSSNEGPADVTGLVLKDLVDKNDASIANGQGLSGVPEGAAAPAPEDEKVAVDDLGVKEGGRKKRSFQDRIDTLTRRYHEKSEENSAMAAQLAQLSGLIAAQQQQLLALRAPHSPAPSAGAGVPFGELLSGGEGKDAGGAGAFPSQPPALDVSKIVEEAISRYDQKQRSETAQVTQFRAAQEDAFQDACEEFPELGDKRTGFRRAFDELVRKSPLMQLPDGPYQIALQVRGILADEVTRNARKVEQKRLASVVVPSPSTTDSAPAATRAAIQKELDKVYADMRAGNNDFGLFRKARILKAQLMQTK